MQLLTQLLPQFFFSGGIFVFAQLVLYLYNKTKARQLNGSHISMPRASWALLTDKEETKSVGVLNIFTANCGRPALFAHLPGTKHHYAHKRTYTATCKR